ncbi:helix-turn-helix domain-containing protein [Azonexus sp. R2A61]|uniref:helix-turn-helix domain-containing protein n=1 Tax=Azonexus sp. R2A61 TaxID=2744443 RepID=UPI001F2C5BC9|nr:helix-turn-helix domain-containing protein [Azonexus sp. R2A61]
MSTEVDEIIFGFGRRFREERLRLGFTQGQLAAPLVTTERTIISYEKGSTPPKLDKLILFYGIGADIGYVITGRRSIASDGGAVLHEPESRPYTPAARVAEEIFSLPLTDSDAEMLLTFAKRLANDDLSQTSR